jgi:hypothetical protein
VPRDAVTNLAKAGQIYEETFLKKGWQRVIQVRELGKSPEVFSDIQVARPEPEEIRQNAKAFRHLVFKGRFHTSTLTGFP